MGARRAIAILLLMAVVAGCAPAVGEPSRPAATPFPTATVRPGSPAATRQAVPTLTEPDGPAPEEEQPEELGADGTRTPVLPPIPSLMPAPLLPARVPPAVGVEPVERATADLAGRLGVEAAEIELVTVYVEDFPSGDLGCPLPKEAPPDQPAFVMGQEIVLSVAGTEYAYRVGGGTMIFCGER